MKKIKLIIFHPYSSLGGADKSLARLIDGLDHNKYDIFFLSLKRIYITKFLKKKVKTVAIKKTKTIFSVFFVREFLKKFNENEKIIFLSNQNFANIISFIILQKFRSIKHVVIERNHLDEFKYNSNVFQFFKKKFIKFLMKITYKYADLVIGNAKELSEDLTKLINKKVKTIYNPAFDKSIFKLSKSKIKLKKQKNKKIILNIGRLELQKNQITLLKAIRKIDDVELIIIGYGSQEKKLEDFIKKNMLRSKVHILKNVSNPYPFFKIADLFVLSSVYEGFPNVLTEAIMFKVPIISSNCKSGPYEILMKKKGPQIFKKENYIDLRKKILSHFRNKQVICSRQKNLYASLKRFDKKIILTEYDKIFQALVENNSSND